MYTRVNTNKKFRLMTKCSSKYLNSPLYRGSTLWNSIDKDVQCIPTMGQHEKAVDKMYVVYQDLL